MLPRMPAREDDDTQAPGASMRAGPCRAIRRLGAGGMGTVFLAEMVEDRPYAAAGTLVALKVLHRAASEENADLARFRREAAIGQAARGDAIVRTHEWGEGLESGEARPWLVMELVEGRSVREVLQEMGRLPEPLVRHLGARTARGLAQLHAAGIIHRDVKPANVVITPEHAVKLTDFGIARRLADFNDLTEAGHFVGTLRYAAPEQLRGLPISNASDLYGLGVMLFEAATGAVPFDRTAADDGLAPGSAIPRAAERHPDISALLDEVIADLLAPLPAQRPASASLVAEILESGERHAWWRERETLASERAVRRRPRVATDRDVAMVGREAPLAGLVAAVRDVAAGRGGACVVHGEAGLGKTRLLAEVVLACERENLDVDVLAASHAPGDAAARLDGVQAAIVNHFGASRLRAGLARVVRSRTALVPAWAAMLADDPAELATPGGDALTADAIEDLVSETVRNLAAERPVVVLVEDLHFAGPLAQRLLRRLWRDAARAPVLVIATSRHEPAGELREALEASGGSLMPLTRLTGTDVQRIIELLLGSETIAAGLAPSLVERSDGNPFFVLSLLDQMRERRVLEKSLDGSWRLRGKPTDLAVPGSLAGILRARLDALDDDHRQILDAGAVLGFEFDAAVLARVLERPALSILQALAQVQRRSGVVTGHGALFRFDHHMLQEVAVAAMPAALRQELHRRIALVLEEDAARDGASVSGDLAVRLATHWLRAQESARARPHLLPAVSALESRLDADGVARLGQLVRDVTGGENPFEGSARHGDADDRLRGIRWQLHLGQAAYLRGELDSAARSARLCLASAGSPVPEDAARRAGALLRPAMRQAAHLALPAILTRALSPARQRLHREAARAAGLLALVHASTGDAEGYVLASLTAQNLAEKGGRDSAVALGSLGATAASLRMRPLSRRYFARGRAAATGRDRDTVDVVLFEAAAAFSAGDLAGCQRLVSEAFDRATAASYRLGRERACLWRGTIAATLGRFEDAEREYDMARGEDVVLATGAHGSMSVLGVASALLSQLRIEDAAVALDEAAAQVAGSPLMRAVWSGLSARLAGLQGDDVTARRHAVTAVDLVAGHEMVVLAGMDAPLQDSTRVLLDALERARAAGSHDADAIAHDARRALACQERWARLHPVRWPRALLHRARLGRLDGDEGRRVIARLEQARAVASDRGLPLDEALALLELARLEATSASPDGKAGDACAGRTLAEGALRALAGLQAPEVMGACHAALAAMRALDADDPDSTLVR